ncbi:MAG: transketolase [Terriglobia bacterium]
MEGQTASVTSNSSLSPSQLDQLCINTIRFLAVDGVQKANSGHPGMPMGAAPMAYVLWTRHLKHDPAKPAWPNRDRFVLSAGHGSMLLYSLLHLTGYDMPIAELQQFRQWGSKTPGHPEHWLVPGIETTTGPLGQGFGNGVGMAIAQKYLAAHFNRPGHEIVDYKIYAIAGDGCLMEGISSEAASLAGHLQLDNLIYFYDDNHISIEGDTQLAFTEDRGKRFEAYGWFVQKLGDGNDLAAIDAAIRAAQAERGRPSIIMIRTHIGYGSPNKHDTAEAHGTALGVEEVKLTKQNLGWPLEPPFLVPDQARAHFRLALGKGAEAEAEWQAKLAAYRAAFPDLAAEWDRYTRGELTPGWQAKIPTFSSTEKPMATRQASGKVLNALSPVLPTLLGGSADLAPSTDTLIKGEKDFEPGNYGGRNFHFGVREHGMASVMNGMALSGLIPYGATFFVFSDYLRPSLRLAAVMGVHAVFVFTHDSVFLGEDGPTHEPVEHLAACRIIPHLCSIRPADANETAVAWRVALEHKSGPVALMLTRQALPIFDRSKYASAQGLEKGAYIFADAAGKTPELILIATGSEVAPSLEAYEKLGSEGIATRLVSMPSWDLFEKQPQSYRDEVLPPGVTARLAVEAGVPFGWERYVGSQGAVHGINRFGASAPYKIIAEKLGFTGAHIAELAHKLLGR